MANEHIIEKVISDLRRKGYGLAEKTRLELGFLESNAF